LTTIFFVLNLQGIELPNEVASTGLRFLEYSGLVGLMCFIFSLMFCFTRIESMVERRTKDAMERAEAANHAKSEFLANMSHEIRTPMTAILGFTDLLREDGNTSILPEHRLQTIDTIKRASTHLMTVINDILDLSKIEAGKMTVEAIDTNLVRVLHEVTSLMRPRAIDKGLKLTVKLQSPIPERIVGDPTRLRQVLLNLIGNAIKFTDAGCVNISVCVEEQDDRSLVLIDVEDTGPGMSPEQAARLFTPFCQADNTVTRKFGGTGLGLTICRRLAEMMGGNVDIVRTAPQAGACFRVTLPLLPIAGASIVDNLDIVRPTTSRENKASSVTLNGRILLAEDGFDNQRLIAFHLRKAGAIVDIADNGVIALELIEKADCDQMPYKLLLTDMQMPEMDGYMLARTLRSRNSILPVVALTAHAMAEDRDKCLNAGCNDYTSKPIDKVELLDVCHRWMV
jgi:signal transduction histidine kinase